MSQEDRLNPMALSVEQAAQTLGIPRGWVEDDVAAGAPTNADGTVNLVHYAAWLNVAGEQSEPTRREPEGRVPQGCDAEGAHNPVGKETDDGAA